MAKILNIDLDKENINKICEFEKGETVDVSFSSFHTTIEQIKQSIKEINNIKNCDIEHIVWNAKYKEIYIDDKQKINDLKAINTFCDKIDVELQVVLDATHNDIERNTPNNLILAEKTIDDLKKKLNKMTIDGRKLTIAEKFFCVYDFVANRSYNSGLNYADNRMRSWIGTLTGNLVICSGFSATLKCLCDRIFDKDELFCAYQTCEITSRITDINMGIHANNLVYIKDDFYKLNGVYVCDTCWDSCIDDKQNTNTFNFFLVPTLKIKTDKKTSYKFEESPDLLYNLAPLDIDIEEDMCVDEMGDNIVKYLTHKFGKSAFSEISQMAIEIRNEKLKTLKQSQNDLKNMRDNSIIHQMLVEELKSKVGISRKEFIEKSKQFATSKYVDVGLLRNGLKAVAKLRGMEVGPETDTWIENELALFEHRQTYHFATENTVK